MSRIVDEMLTQNNNNDKDKDDNYMYILIIVDQLSQLGQLRHTR